MVWARVEPFSRLKAGRLEPPVAICRFLWREIVQGGVRSPMNLAHFMRIERTTDGRSRHVVVHTHDPRMVLELAPDRDSPDGMGKGVIKRVCVPNSWAGNYSQYGKLIAAAQEFFQQSRAEPVPKRESKRLGL
jgi:hypothetical protein